jgi:hypothetical protein
MARQFWSDKNSGETWAVETDESGVVTGACGPLDSVLRVEAAMDAFEFDAEEGAAIQERADEFRLAEPERVTVVMSQWEFAEWVDPAGEMNEDEIEELQEKFRGEWERRGWWLDWTAREHSATPRFVVARFELDEDAPEEAPMVEALQQEWWAIMQGLNQFDWVED